MKDNDFSILDFGCGLGGLYTFLKRRYTNFRYKGVDIVKEFINENKRNFPAVSFELISSYEAIQNQFDYIISSGVFNIQYSPGTSNEPYIFKAISHLFSMASVSLSLDFMHDEVDYQQENAHHQNIISLYSFVIENLSRRVIIDRSTFPYEFTITIFKNQTIARPENLYEEIHAFRK